MALDSHKIMGLSGTQADNEVFGEYIKTNLKLYQLNNDITLSTDAAANYIRNEVR
jgi:20S proteasome alpha/beta subunit